MTYYIPVDTFATGNIVVGPEHGVVYAEDHPLVREFPKLFKPIEVIDRRGVRSVEQATAAPGEKRTIRR